jgi:2-polyprenyl-3-methyl-5-hydroxy-6-metoxy-1,4-benzoquinol methylase
MMDCFKKVKIHKKLAEKYNFAFVGDNVISDSALQSALDSENLYAGKLISDDKKSLGEFLRHLSAGKKMCCPVCGSFPSKPDEVISRNETRTYRRCSKCGMVYMAYTTIEDKKYQKAYFFEDYKKQYGKTYEEDFESIKAQGMRRVSVIKSLAGARGETLLDIGCAYGPFLSAATDDGINAFGTDIADDAVAYVQNKLKLPAVCSAFPEIDTAEEFGIAQFDIVTMWYVIEHFKDLGSVLRKVSSLVKKGGVFAFSTPSGEGISAVSDKDHFYQISPTDHYTIWEPGRADSILRQFGFKVERIVSTGHHPERFPSIKKSGAKPGSLRWMLVEAQSHAKRLGDTVEIYCKKI